MNEQGGQTDRLINDGIVLFFGAGASRCEQYPLMDTFLDDLKASLPRGESEHDQRRRDAYEALLAFRAKLSTVKDKVNTDFDNIESLYSAAEMYSLAFPEEVITVRDKVLKGSEIPGKIAMAIWEMCRWSPFTDPIHRDPETHMGLLTRIETLGNGILDRITFITTNYDILIEIAAMRTRWRLCYGNHIKFDEFDEEFVTQQASTRLLKLHGSTNWFVTDDNKTHCDASNGQFENFGGRGPGGSLGYRWPNIQASNYSAPGTPLIIPPTYAKTANEDLFECVWREAMEAISGAKFLAFIGYSFPQTATFLQHLINIGLLQNHDLRSVLIVNKDPEIKEHVSTNLFDKNFADKRVKFIEGSFEGEVAMKTRGGVHRIIDLIVEEIEQVERTSAI